MIKKLLGHKMLDEHKRTINDNFETLWNRFFPLASILKIGNDPNYSQFDTDGSLRHFGDATIWDDIVQSVTADNLYSAAGSVDFNYTDQWVVMQKDGLLTNPADRVFVNYQMPHATKADSLFRLHFHWSQSNNTSRTISGEYRVQDNGAATTTTWTPFTATCTYGAGGGNVFDTTAWDFGVNGNYNQITRLVDIPLAGHSMSALIQVRFTRSDSNTGADIYILTVDGHVEKDSGGSRLEYSK